MPQTNQFINFSCLYNLKGFRLKYEIILSKLLAVLVSE